MMKIFAIFLLFYAASAQSAESNNSPSQSPAHDKSSDYGTGSTEVEENSNYPYDPAHPISANLTVASDYVFRGITQTNHLAALQGGFDWRPPNGFFASMWGSNVQIPGSPATLLLDGYVGYVYHFSKDWSLNLGALYLTFVGDRSLNTWAFPLQGAWKTFSLEMDYSPVWEGSSKNYYVVAGWKDKIISDFKLGIYFGYSMFTGNESNYADYRISVSREFLGLDFDLTENYVNQAFVNGEAAGSTLVFSVSKFF